MTPHRSDLVGGSALIVCLIILAIVTVLGTAAILTSSVETKITHATRISEEAFYAAEAGIRHILCLSDPLGLYAGDVVRSEALTSSARSGPAYEVEVLQRIDQLWGMYIIHLASTGYDEHRKARRVIRCDMQVVPSSEEGGLIREPGSFRYEYSGRLPAPDKRKE